MLKEAQTSLYEGFPISYLASILLMYVHMELVMLHGWIIYSLEGRLIL